uniref:Uncharacterized protein n=1 Tax=Arundo donax TaxID=35708 RepID=A0A0A9DIL8_ARUDO
MSICSSSTSSLVKSLGDEDKLRSSATCMCAVFALSSSLVISTNASDPSLLLDEASLSLSLLLPLPLSAALLLWLPLSFPLSLLSLSLSLSLPLSLEVPTLPSLSLLTFPSPAVATGEPPMSILSNISASSIFKLGTASSKFSLMDLPPSDACFLELSTSNSGLSTYLPSAWSFAIFLMTLFIFFDALGYASATAFSKASRPIPFGFSESIDIKRLRTSVVLSSTLAEGALALRFIPLDILPGVAFSSLLFSSLFISKGVMTSLFASDPTGNEGMLALGCSGEGAGEVVKFPLGILFDNFTLETDLVGAIIAA